MSQIAYIGLGSNLGNRQETILSALRLLGSEPKIRVVKVSTLLENPAVGGPPGSPVFLNAAAEIDTEFSAVELLAYLLKVEQRLGRQRQEKWGPRTIDLDLLIYGDQVIHDRGLIVPHPFMAQRRFVLAPLAEIAPDLVHPVLSKTIVQMLADLDQ